MRILVTGASGLLGLNLALEISTYLDEGSGEHQVFGLVNSNLLRTNDFSVLVGDLLIPGTAERIIEETEPDWVINCAALAIVDACETDPVRAQNLNTELPAKLAAYVARGGARLLHVSTDAVFDGVRGNYAEEDQPNPLSIYGKTKLAGERLAADTNPETLIARVNFYGWSLSTKRSLSEFFFYNLVSGKRINGFTDVYFCPLLVNDLAHLFMEMIGKRMNGLYHVVSRECISKYEFGVALAKKFNLDEGLISPISVSDAGLKAARSPRLTLSTTKLSNALGKSPPDIAAGLERYHQLYKQGYPDMLKGMGL